VRLRGEDAVIGMVVTATDDATLITVCENGYGKRTPIEDYPIKGRGNQGVINIKVTDRNGPVVGIARCHDGDDVMFITESGMIVRSPAIEMRPMGRNTQGTRLVSIKGGDKIVAVEVVRSDDIEEEEAVLETQAAAERQPGAVDAPATESVELDEADFEVEGDDEPEDFESEE